MGQELMVLHKAARWRVPDRHLVALSIVVVIVGVALVLCVGKRTLGRAMATSQQPPWVYGLPNTRFTVVEFADLECAYCRMYFPTLRAWVDAHPEVNWEWRHLPLASHEPAATQAARLAECAGEVGGQRLFWSTVEWLYSHSDHPTPLSEGPFSASQAQVIGACLQTDRPDAIVRKQVAEATREEVTATPTLRVVDRRLGRSITLTGLVPPDVLSSAIDGLAAPTEPAPAIAR
jgi:protein-disulfide isomerase